MKIRPFLLFPAVLFFAALFVARAQDKSSIDPTASKIEFENDQIRVLRATVAPHQKTPLHSHRSRFGVTLTENNLRISVPDSSAQTSIRAANEFFWSEPVTHQVENISDSPMQNIEIELKQAKGPSKEVKPAAVGSRPAGTADDPVPVELEPHHRVVFENQYVRVLDVIVNPGETTLFHKHSLDNVPVILTDATMKRQFAGGDWGPSPAKAGSVGFTIGTDKPYVHRISNVGTTVFHVMDVQILP
jgi:quercetin dioxygenase-like cupin family protein